MSAHATFCPVEPAAALREALEQVPLVGVGEVHWCARSLDFIVEMIASAALAGACNDIVIEFGNARHQTLVDRFMAGDAIEVQALYPVWRDTLHFMLWSPDVYPRFFQRIRDLNRTRPAAQRLRVVLAEEAFDWSTLTSARWRRLHLRRDDHYRAVIEHEVLARGRRALLIFGATHLLKCSHPGMISPNGPAAPLAAQLISHHGDISRIVWPYFMAKGDFLTASERETLPIPSLTWLQHSPLAERDFRPPFAVRQTARARAGDFFDACLYLGPLERRVEVPASVTEDGDWLDEVARRLTVLDAAQRERIARWLPCAVRERIRMRAVL